MISILCGFNACLHPTHICLCRYYNNKVRKAPHVVGHYAAGARLIGLTEREMAKRFATLSVGSKEADSPYAQPVVGIFLNKQKALRMTGKIKLKVNKSLDVRTEDGTGTEDKVTNLPKVRSHIDLHFTCTHVLCIGAHISMHVLHIIYMNCVLN